MVEQNDKTDEQDGTANSGGIPDLESVPVRNLPSAINEARAVRRASIPQREVVTAPQATNPRLARALGRPSVAPELEDELPAPPATVTDETVAAWIAQVIPLMEPESRYRKHLMTVLQRYEYKKKAGN